MAGKRRGDSKDKFRLGEHLVQCDLSGFTYYASDTRKTWDGFIVGKDQWEPRHPQDFVEVRADRQYVIDARPPNEGSSEILANPYIVLENSDIENSNIWYLTTEDNSRLITG